tara:strand:+ start:763 stop:900 length:138 start_codon:yes stop_codon:yes gene_type:complete
MTWQVKTIFESTEYESFVSVPFAFTLLPIAELSMQQPQPYGYPLR